MLNSARQLGDLPIPRHGRTVVVTGAGGTIGRAVVACLQAAGRRVIAVLSPSNPTSDENAIIADLTSASIELDENPATIVHLAAVVPQSCSRASVDECARRTRRIDRTVHTLAQSTGARVIYASGSSLYDAASDTLKTELASVAATHPYLRAKLDGERLFSELPGCCIARISSPYGEGMSGASVLGRFIEAARRDQAIEVWGTGKREQDFIHATDIASFVLRVIERDAEGVFNVVSGRPVSMLFLARSVCQIVGAGSVTLPGHDDPQEHHTARFDFSKAAEVLGWKPRVELESGIAICRDLEFRS